MHFGAHILSTLGLLGLCIALLYTPPPSTSFFATLLAPPMSFKEVPVSQAYRLINPGCVLIIGAQNKEGKQNAMTIAWQSPAARSDPAIALIGMGQSHCTTSYIEETGVCTLNIPTKKIIDTVTYLGSNSGFNVDKLKNIAVEPAKNVTAPIISDCIASLEGKILKKESVGKIFLYQVEIVRAQVRSDLFDEKWLPGAELCHHCGGDGFYFSP